jgi:hypothetical protein
MLKSLVVIAALAFVAPGLAVADDHKPVGGRVIRGQVSEGWRGLAG